jgi:4-amino-4-deoxy-L-arabinose transferase-like glycosyltransferase
MTRNQVVASVLLVVAVAVAVRVVAAALIVFPKPEDTAYYVGVARNLLEGRGLVSDALWSYQTTPLAPLPRAAFEVWLPLPTFLAAIPMAIFGSTFAAAQVSSVAVGALVPVLAWRLAADAGEERGLPPGRVAVLALGAGLTSAVYLPLVLHSALPDSTIPFTAIVLAACLLMSREARSPRRAGRPPRSRLGDPRLLVLGLLIGLGALTRNEAAWLGLAWAVVAWSVPGTTRSERVGLIAVPALIAVAVFVPWAIRDWAAFGSPLPGQAASNALSLNGRDIFAWSDPPTLQRYLAAGWLRLLELRLIGFAHNLFNVLVLLGMPISVIGLAALPWFGRGRALRPLLVFSALTFTITTLLFPVSTTWGTFLHAAGAIHVLLIITCLMALDWLIAAVRVRRSWTRPVAWLAPTLTVFGAVLFSLAALPSFGGGSRETQSHYAALAVALRDTGVPLDAQHPVITNFPIWLAETLRIPALALPDEPAASVASLAAAFPGTSLVVVDGRDEGRYPAAFDSGEPGTACFQELALDATGAGAPLLADTRVFRVVCP